MNKRGRKHCSLQKLEKWAFELLEDSILLSKLALGVTYYSSSSTNGHRRFCCSKPDNIVEAFLAKHKEIDVVVGRVLHTNDPFERWWVDVKSYEVDPFAGDYFLENR